MLIRTSDILNPDNTVFEEISEGTDIIKVGNRELNARAYVSAFNFKVPTSKRRLDSCREVNATVCNWQGS